MASGGLLVIAPHPDDECLGAGGFIASCANQVPVTILTVAAHMPPLYSDAVHEMTKAEALEAHAELGVTDSRFLDLPAVFVSRAPVPELNGAIMSVVEDVNPSIVLCAYPDRHVDHKAIFDAVMVACRPIRTGREIKILAAYETLSETHWNAPHIEPNFTPNWVVDITDTIDRKLRALASYKSQVSPFPGPRSIEALRALATFRGTQAGFAFGEGFHIIRMTAGAGPLIQGFGQRRA